MGAVRDFWVFPDLCALAPRKHSPSQTPRDLPDRPRNKAVLRRMMYLKGTARTKCE